MADNVQFILDRLAETFQMMRDAEVFNDQEVRSVVKKITDFEYMMARTQLELSDIQRYLQYVLQLFELQNLRVGKLSKDEFRDKKVLVMKLRHKVIRHIYYIFFRSTRRFKGNHSLWQQLIDFLQTNKCNSLLNGVFGQVLSLFPKHEHYWLQAVSYELSTNMNSHSTRVLLQRSLRINPKSQALWMKYFEMEIWYILKIEERQTVLSIDETATSKLFEAPYIIFTHAVENFPKDIVFAVEFYRVALQTTAYTLMRRIEKTLIETMKDQPLLWKELSLANISILDQFNSSSSSDLKTDYPQLSNLLIAVLGCSEYAVSLLDEGYQVVEPQHHNEFAIMVDEVGEHYLDKAMGFLSRIPGIYKGEMGFSGEFLNSWQNLLKRLLLLSSKVPIQHLAFTFLNIRLGLYRMTSSLGINNFVDTLPNTIAGEVLERLKSWRTSAKKNKEEPNSGFNCQALIRMMNSLLRIYAEERSDSLASSIRDISEAIIRLGTSLCAMIPGSFELMTKCNEISIAFSINQSDASALINSTLQDIVSSRDTRREDRVQWCVYYLKLQLVFPEGNFLHVYNWMENTFRANPFLTTDLDMSEIYEVVLQFCIGVRDRDAFKRVVQRAVEQCPLNKAFWDHYERVLREEGNHMAANHVRWLASRAS